MECRSVEVVRSVRSVLTALYQTQTRFFVPLTPVTPDVAKAGLAELLNGLYKPGTQCKDANDTNLSQWCQGNEIVKP